MSPIDSSKLTQFYLFIANEFPSVNDAAAAMDYNGDSAVIKAEFSQFVHQNCQNIGLTASEITQLFSSFDTKYNSNYVAGTHIRNANAWDANEQENFGQSVEAYKLLSDFLQDLPLPTDLSSVTSLGITLPEITSSVRAGLENIFPTLINQAGGNLDVLQELLEENFDTILKTTIADKVAYKIMATASGLPQSYSYNDDSSLKGIIDHYVNSIKNDSSADIATIVNEITAIVNAYLQTADLGTQVDLSNVNGKDLSQYAYNTTHGLNDLQKAVIVDMLYAAIDPDNSLPQQLCNYSGWQELLNSAMQDYINEKMQSNSYSPWTFSTWKEYIPSMGEGFVESRHYQALLFTLAANNVNENTLNGIPNEYQNVNQYADLNVATMIGNIYNALREVLDDDELARTILVNAQYCPIYQNLVNQVVTECRNNQLTGGVDPEQRLAQLIKQNLAAIKAELGYSSTTGSEDINDLVNSFYGCFKNENSDNFEIDNYGILATNVTADDVRETAKALITAFLALDWDKLTEFINNQLGEGGLNSLDNKAPIAILQMVDRIRQKYNTLVQSGEYSEPVDLGEITADWTTSQLSGPLLAGGNSQTMTCTASLTSSNEVAINDASISYAASLSSGSVAGANVSINQYTGNITVNPKNVTQEGPIRFTVSVMVDGEEVGTKQISLNVKESNWNQDTAENILPDVSTNLSGKTSGGESWNKAKVIAISNFNSNVAEKLQVSAVNMGYDVGVAIKAADALKIYFSSALNAISVANDNNFFGGEPHNGNGAEIRGTSFTYSWIDTDGITHTETCSDQSVFRGSRYVGDVNNMESIQQHGDSTITSGTGIYVGCDTDGLSDSYYIFIDNATILNKFQMFLELCSTGSNSRPTFDEAGNYINYGKKPRHGNN